MAARPRTALLLGVLTCVVGYGGLVMTGQVRGFWQERADIDLMAPAILAELHVSEGDRRHNHRNRDIPEQAPLAITAHFPEYPEWWRNRCHGFFSALFRANLDVSYRLRKPDETPFFPQIEEVPSEMVLPDITKTAAMDQMARYERSLPLDPAEIQTNALFLTDLPVCLKVAAGEIPRRGG